MSQLHSYADREYYSVRNNCFGKYPSTFASINAFALNCTIKLAVLDQERVQSTCYIQSGILVLA